MSEIVALIVDLDLCPANESAKDFFDVYWSDVLDLERSRRDLYYLHYCRTHPILSKREDVFKSRCGCLPLSFE